MILMELIIVISILGMMTGWAMLSLGGVFSKKQFEKEAYTIIDVLKKAQHATARTDRRYAVVFDFIEETYVLRQYATQNLDMIPEEEAIITTGYFSRNCQIDYILFDDAFDTREYGESMENAIFFAGRNGWQNGGKIVLVDIDGNPYTILVNRICGKITLQPGDVDLLVPLDRNELRF